MFRRLIIKRPGLCLLALLIFLITVTSIRPGFYILGWDNYSSYFNLPTNLFRTFFAALRDYRGLGVPSDAESTDIFRQLFYLLLNPFVPQTLLDQFYMLFIFIAGALSLYAFAYLLLRQYGGRVGNERYADIGAFLAAFFYIFNLNTLSTFYFSMVMYVNRFLALPLIFLSFFLVTTQKKISKKIYFLVIFSFLFTSGTCMTPTIFLTVILALFIFGIFSENRKRFLMIFIFYIALQSFWLFPFANYTLQKSGIIRVAPTFIDANETQLNKPASSYEISKQLVLYPNFFDTEYSTLTSLQKLQFHPLSTNYKKPFYALILFIFPLLYIGGSILIFVKHKQFKNLLWLPITIIVFLFLTLKEFSFLGFLYSFFDNLTPYFSVLFRFGDTKFHAFIAFAGSIADALLILWLIDFLSSQNFLKIQRSFVTSFLKMTMIAVTVLPTLFVFRYYLTGLFIGPFMYNKIPSAYFDMAKIINSDKSPSRVLHLPMDSSAYWKSYSWGMFGSSFLNFMLDHPLIDKTFEPASMENAYLDKEIDKLLSNAQFLKTSSEQKVRAEELAMLLRKTNVKYLIIDGTVESSIYPKNLVLWGNFKASDAEKMSSYLLNFGLVRKIKEYDINLWDYKDTYQSFYPLPGEALKILMANQHRKIQLLELKNVLPRVEFIKNATLADPEFKNLLDSSLGFSDNSWLQSSSANGYILFPFERGVLDDSNNGKFNLNFGKLANNLKWGTAFLPPVSNISNDRITNYVDVYWQKIEDKIHFNFYLKKLPDIDNVLYSQKIAEFNIPSDALAEKDFPGFSLVDYLSDWSGLPFKEIGPLRLKVGDSIIPVPKTVDSVERPIATVSVMGGNLDLSVLSFNGRIKTDPREFGPTADPNCFSDALENANYSISKSEVLKITSRNQSSCFYYNLKPFLDPTIDHAEIWFELSGKNTDLDSLYQKTLPITSKPALDQTIKSLDKPNLMRVCVKEPHIDDCYNLHQLVQVKKEKSILAIPLERPLLGTTDMSILLSLKNTTYQKQEVEISDMAVDWYKSIAKTSVSFDPNGEVLLPLDLSNNQSLKLSFPKALGSTSFTFNPNNEGLYVSNKNCDQIDGYRTFRTVDNIFLSYVENCYNRMSQPAHFSSDLFYIWTLEYNLFSGKFPRFLLSDGFRSYVDEYVSINQGYPDIPGFKLFEKPEMGYESLFSNKKVEIKNALYKNAFTYIYPGFELDDQRQKEFAINQDSENEGVVGVKSMSFQSLPTQWAKLSLVIGKSEKTFLTTKDYKSEQILPSLWKVSVKLPKKGDYLLMFREGFDTQWKLIKNLREIIAPSKCDGFANCFVIHQKENNPAEQAFYLFYTPELLNILGWIATIGVITIAIKRFNNL